MAPTDPAAGIDPTEALVVAHIPAVPGSYALLLTLGQPLRVEVGQLGAVTFAPGRYVYFGSAMGPGGLRARIRRHVQPDKLPHWHIDYLTRQVPPVIVHWQLELPGFECAGGTLCPNNTGDRPGPPQSKTDRLECTWCRHVAQYAGVAAPVHRFGSTDCRAGCPAHLLSLPDDMTITQLLGELT